jgi:hypothetical protein
MLSVSDQEGTDGSTFGSANVDWQKIVPGIAPLKPSSFRSLQGSHPRISMCWVAAKWVVENDPDFDTGGSHGVVY